MAARLVAEGALALRVERMAELRRREVDIVVFILSWSIGLQRRIIVQFNW